MLSWLVVGGYMDLVWLQVGRVVLGSKVVSEQSQFVSQQPGIVNKPAERVAKVEKSRPARRRWRCPQLRQWSRAA